MYSLLKLHLVMHVYVCVCLVIKLCYLRAQQSTTTINTADRIMANFCSLAWPGLIQLSS